MVSVIARRQKRRIGGTPKKQFMLTAIPEECSCREWRPSSESRKTGITPAPEKDQLSTEFAYKLIDVERIKNKMPPLRRSENLHHLARLHAANMASKKKVLHSVASVSELQTLLNASLVGENIQRGSCVAKMHAIAMKELDINAGNVLGDEFREYGVAISQGKDGMNYLCQYFR